MLPTASVIIPPHRCHFPIVRGLQIKSSTATVIVVAVVNAHPLARPPTIMPGARATDPANLQAHACAQLGLFQELEQTRRVTPHPSCGGSGGYDVWFPKEQLARVQAGKDVDVSESSLRRWREHLHPHRQTGN